MAIGFHPYFQLTDSTREDWTLSVGAKTQLAAGAEQDPDRRDRADREALPRSARPCALKDFDLDDVFGDLERDAQGRAVMSVKGKTQQLDVLVGPNYQVDRAVLAEPGERTRRGGEERRTRGAAPRRSSTGRTPCDCPGRYR